MKNKPENKCITVSTRYSFNEYKELLKRASKAKKFKQLHGKEVPSIAEYTRMRTLSD